MNTDVIGLHVIFTILAVILYDEGQLCTMIRNTEPSPIHIHTILIMTPCQTLYYLTMSYFNIHVPLSVLLPFSHTQPDVQLYIAPGRAQSALRLLQFTVKNVWITSAIFCASQLCAC